MSDTKMLARMARDQRARRRCAMTDKRTKKDKDDKRKDQRQQQKEKDKERAKRGNDSAAGDADESVDESDEEDEEDEDSEDEDADIQETDPDQIGATLLGIFGVGKETRAKAQVRRNPFLKSEDEPYSKYTRVEHDYFWRLNECTRERITETERDVRILTSDDIPMRFRVLSSDVHPTIKSMALKKLDCIRGAGTSESTKSQQFVDALVRLPIGKYATLPVGPMTSSHIVRAFLQSMQQRLDERVYGHFEAKAHIIRLVAQYTMNPKARGLVIGFHGKVGCGKTELAKAVCECLDLPFGFIALGGSNDSTTLAGHSYTYEGSTWGKIADVLMRCECMNPVIFFDELDKVSDSSGGRQVTNLLVHLTDPSQNDKHADAYFMGLELDLSRAILMFSYNDVDAVNPVLRDRIVEVATEGYTSKEKIIICQQHLARQVRLDFGMGPDDLIFEDAVVRHMIGIIVEEAGVRGLKKAVRDIAGSINLKRIMEEDIALNPPTVISIRMVDSFVKSCRRDAHRDIGHTMYT